MHPEDRFRQIWDILQVFFLIYVGIMIPLREGFDMSYEIASDQFWIELVVDSYFICDIAMNFRTAIYNKHGEIMVSQVHDLHHTQPERPGFAISLVACDLMR